jgi:hypothetical protein
MSNKSLFEKLFEEVMENDEAALGIDGGDTGDMGGDLGGDDMGGDDMGGDDVTITLDKATAQKLCDLIQAAMGGDEGEDDMGGDDLGDDLGGDMGGEGGEDFGGSEDAEDEDEEDEDAEEDEEDEGSLKESPQAQYKNFGNDGQQMTKKTNMKTTGLAANATGGGQAAKKDQTQGTEKYVPFSNDGKKMTSPGNMKVSGARTSTPSGPSKSVFHP